MNMKILLTILLSVAFNQGHAYEVLVWVGEEEAKLIPEDSEKRRFGEDGIFPHPCGFVRVIDLKKLPPPGSEDFIGGTEKVVEFLPEGYIVQKWSMPVDSYVIAVEKESVIVRYKKDQALKIGANGVLKRVEKPDLDRELFQCPGFVSELFGDSVFDRCYKYKDLATKKDRYIAFESVCT